MTKMLSARSIASAKAIGESLLDKTLTVQAITQESDGKGGTKETLQPGDPIPCALHPFGVANAATNSTQDSLLKSYLDVPVSTPLGVGARVVIDGATWCVEMPLNTGPFICSYLVYATV